MHLREHITFIISCSFLSSSPSLPPSLSHYLLPLLPLSLCVLLRAPFFWHLIRFACNGKINIENGKWELQTKEEEREEREEEASPF